MKTIFDHLRECAGNGDMPTLDAEDAQRIVETYDELLGALGRVLPWAPHYPAGEASGVDGPYEQARKAIKRATESRPLQIGRG